MSGTSPGPGAPQFRSELAVVLLAEQNFSDLLEIIVNLAASAIDEVDGASVSMVVHDRERFETTNASSLVVRDIDEAQYEKAAGPCVEAIRTGREVSISLPTPRWPQFSERAVMAGMRSVWSLPLMVKERTTGALNLYSSRPQPWTGGAAPAARGLAGQAAVVLANAASLANAETTNGHLQEALESRDLIGQAKGILMARQNVSANEAFDILRQASQTSGRKLREIAADVVSRLERPPEPA